MLHQKRRVLVAMFSLVDLAEVLLFADSSMFILA